MRWKLVFRKLSYILHVTTSLIAKLPITLLQYRKKSVYWHWNLQRLKGLLTQLLSNRSSYKELPARPGPQHDLTLCLGGVPDEAEGSIRFSGTSTAILTLPFCFTFGKSLQLPRLQGSLWVGYNASWNLCRLSQVGVSFQAPDTMLFRLLFSFVFSSPSGGTINWMVPVLVTIFW